MRKYFEKSLIDTLSKAGVITILTASCFVFGCKDDDAEKELKPDKFLTATVGGNTFTAAAITSEVSSNGNAVSIEGVSSDGTLIQINLNLTDTKAGETYTVGLHQNGWYKDASGTFFLMMVLLPSVS